MPERRSVGSSLCAASSALRRLGLAALPWLVVEALVSCTPGGTEVVISEFMASNASGVTDIDGETSDWIELHNRGKAPVNLEGWCLTDNEHQPDKWRFPAVELPVDGYLVVFASGKHQISAPSQLHTSFRLKATTDYLALLFPTKRVAAAFAPYPDQRNDVSFGLTSSGAPGFLSHPTPGAPNATESASPAALRLEPSSNVRAD